MCASQCIRNMKIEQSTVQSPLAQYKQDVLSYIWNITYIDIYENLELFNTRSSLISITRKYTVWQI